MAQKRIIDLTEGTTLADEFFVHMDGATSGSKKYRLTRFLETMGGNLAAAYDATATYALGSYCSYMGVLYECTTAITTAEAWTAGHWTAVCAMDEVAALISDVAADVATNASAISDLNEDLGDLSEVKAALLACFQNVAWTTENGQTYYNALYEALYDTSWTISSTLTGCTSNNAAQSVTKGDSYTATLTASEGYTLTDATVSITMGGTDVTSQVYSSGVISIASVTGNLVISVSAVAIVVSSLSAVFNQGQNVIYADDDLDSLKDYLTVTATYSDSTTETLADSAYTLSGTLAQGTCTITVTYSDVTTTFTATVSAAYWDYKWTASEGTLPTGMTCEAYDFTTESGAMYVLSPNLNFDTIGDCEIKVECKFFETTGEYSNNNPQITIISQEVSDGVYRGIKLVSNSSLNPDDPRTYSGMAVGINGVNAYLSELNGSQYHTYDIQSNSRVYSLFVDDVEYSLTQNDNTTQWLNYTGIVTAMQICGMFVKSIKFRRIGE